MQEQERSGHVLITGGAGFIGTNLGLRLLASGRNVVVLDNLSREGVDRNARTLAKFGGRQIEIIHGDCRDAKLVSELVAGARAVYHLAAQVAVTTSLTDPALDFETNLRGTFNVLEALRAQKHPARLLFTSTNKVYGALSGVPLEAVDGRYRPVDTALRARGVGEETQLDFCSPYGCSKGAADQYVLDYTRSYGLPAVVFRMSCIYGPHQCGNEDQGWVAHFLLRALEHRPITIYGDGCQVRDLLFVDDLVDAMQLAVERAETLELRVFNIGGGVANSVSLLDVIEAIRSLTGERLDLGFEPARVGDQRYYASDISRFRTLTGWAPRVGVEEGIGRLKAWFAQRMAPRQLHERRRDVSAGEPV